MNRILGFLMFWLGIGMLIGMFIPNHFVVILIAAFLLLVGYNLFCC